MTFPHVYVRYAAIVRPTPRPQLDPVMNHIAAHDAAPRNPNVSSISRLRPNRSATAPAIGINTTSTNAQNDATYVNSDPGAIGIPMMCSRPFAPTAFVATAGRYWLRNTATTVVSNVCAAQPYVYQANRCRRSAGPANAAPPPSWRVCTVCRLSPAAPATEVGRP